jgi:hypothetical protein
MRKALHDRREKKDPFAIVSATPKLPQSHALTRLLTLSGNLLDFSLRAEFQGCM